MLGSIVMHNNLLPSLVPNVTLGLTQIDSYTVPEKFKDSDGITWVLEKSYTDPLRNLPDPNRIQITNIWNHKFLGDIKTPVYVYVVEGTILPRTPSEKPVRVLLQWFSQTNIKDWSLASISQPEWLMANMYVANVSDSRMSKLKALCNYSDKEPVAPETNTQVGLLDIPEIVTTPSNSSGSKKGKIL